MTRSLAVLIGIALQAIPTCLGWHALCQMFYFDSASTAFANRLGPSFVYVVGLASALLWVSVYRDRLLAGEEAAAFRCSLGVPFTTGYLWMALGGVFDPVASLFVAAFGTIFVLMLSLPLQAQVAASVARACGKQLDGRTASDPYRGLLFVLLAAWPATLGIVLFLQSGSVQRMSIPHFAITVFALLSAAVLACTFRRALESKEPNTRAAGLVFCGLLVPVATLAACGGWFGSLPVLQMLRSAAGAGLAPGFVTAPAAMYFVIRLWPSSPVTAPGIASAATVERSLN